MKELPAVNAEIDGDDIVYKNHYDIGVAVGTEQGLVVPVVRDADAQELRRDRERDRRARPQGARRQADDRRSAGRHVHDLERRRLRLAAVDADPQPAAIGILGMHKIEQRPIAIGDKIVIRPMMYVALSYDHRIVDGREAVTFLVRVKECVEDPARLLLEHLSDGRPIRYDLIVVIGAGPGGYVAAIRAAAARACASACIEKTRRARRHLPQRRLHPVEGAAAIVRELRRGAARVSPSTASRSARSGSTSRR